MNHTDTTQRWNDQTKFILFAALGILGLAAYVIGVIGVLAPDSTQIIRPIALSAVIPVAIFVVAYNFLPRFREFVLAQDLRTLTFLQSWRVMGFGFLFLTAYDVLPGLFGWPAGFGDFAIGLAAPFVAWRLTQDPAFAQSRRFLTFHALGLLDFAAAVVTSFLTSGAFPGLVTGNLTSAPMEVWPLNIFPSFIVPIFIILHLVVFLKLRHIRKSADNQAGTTKTTARLGFASIVAAGLLLAGQSISNPAVADSVIASANASASPQSSFGGFEPPKGWLPPPIDPTGVQLQTKKLAPGVYALLSNKPPVDNSGFIVGERGVLVIDAHINGAMAQQIQDAVRRVTDKPILYLVNTNYHGDHTFGNYAFPAQTKIIAHHKTAEAMRDFEEERKNLLPTVNGNAAIFDGVRLRLPYVTFKETLTLDLGGRSVELHHFGHGNTPGDTVVYEPKAKVAWTGNLLLGEKTIPWAIEGNVQAYRDTINRMAKALDIQTIIPGHVLISDRSLLDTYARYLNEHIEAVRDAIEEGKSLDETLSALPLAENYLAPKESALAPARVVIQGFHRWNIKKTYEELKHQHN